jgi:hypothetical protein
MEVGEAWKKSHSGTTRFNVFTDGSQGGEAEMVRRMRIGQLQAALLSVVGLREIEPSIAALQNLPLAFRSWEELDYVREKMRPSMEKKFLEKGYVVLAWGDAGWVRFFSKQAAAGDYEKPRLHASSFRTNRHSALYSNRHDQCCSIYALLCLGVSNLQHSTQHARNQLGPHCWCVCHHQKVLG